MRIVSKIGPKAPKTHFRGKTHLVNQIPRQFSVKTLEKSIFPSKLTPNRRFPANDQIDEDGDEEEDGNDKGDLFLQSFFWKYGELKNNLKKIDILQKKIDKEKK